MPGDIGHVAIFAEKRDKGDEGNNLSVRVSCVEIAFIHRVIQSGFSHGKGKKRAFFLPEPFIGHTIEGIFDFLVSLLERTVFQNRDTGFFRMVDIHAHFCPLFAADLIIFKGKPCFFAAFYIAKALTLIFFEKVTGDT